MMFHLCSSAGEGWERAWIPAEPGGFVLCGPRLCALFSGASATWVPLCWEPRSITGGKTRLWLTLYSKPSTWGQSMFADECRPLQTQLRPFQIKGDGILQATFPSVPRADNHWLEVGICCVLRVNPRKTCLPFTKSEETTGKLSVCVCVCKPGPVGDSVPRFPHLSPPVCFRIK